MCSAKVNNDVRRKEVGSVVKVSSAICASHDNW